MARQPRSLEKRIRASYEDLPGSECALADVVLEFPGDILLHSATSLAERAGVSKAAVTRFIKRLGYSDYREMQREVREAQQAGEPLYLNASLMNSAQHGDAVERHIERDMVNIRQTFEAARRDDLNAVAQAALAARRVWVIGFRNSYYFASYVRRQLIQTRPDVILLPFSGQVIMEDLASATARDLAIIIGLRRRVPLLRRTMEILRDQGVPIAYVTDRGAVSTPKLATWCFPCQTRAVSLFDSYTGVISLLNYLCTDVVAKAADAGRTHLSRIEDLMALAGEIDVGN